VFLFTSKHQIFRYLVLFNLYKFIYTNKFSSNFFILNHQIQTQIKRKSLTVSLPCCIALVTYRKKEKIV